MLGAPYCGGSIVYLEVFVPKTRIVIHKRRIFVLALLAVPVLAGWNTAAGLPTTSGDAAGFWLGLWHGIIVLITFTISLFDNDVNLYEIHNNGNWYNFGFVLGAGILMSISITRPTKLRSREEA
jgi:hypothetical protein